MLQTLRKRQARFKERRFRRLPDGNNTTAFPAFSQTRFIFSLLARSLRALGRAHFSECRVHFISTADFIASCKTHSALCLTFKFQILSRALLPRPAAPAVPRAISPPAFLDTFASASPSDSTAKIHHSAVFPAARASAITRITRGEMRISQR